jgi:hypothetical protein
MGSQDVHARTTTFGWFDSLPSSFFSIYHALTTQPPQIVTLLSMQIAGLLVDAHFRAQDELAAEKDNFEDALPLVKILALVAKSPSRFRPLWFPPNVNLPDFERMDISRDEVVAIMKSDIQPDYSTADACTEYNDQQRERGVVKLARDQR